MQEVLLMEIVCLFTDDRQTTKSAWNLIKVFQRLVSLFLGK